MRRFIGRISSRRSAPSLRWRPFDTAFHHNQPALAQRFALPAEITKAGVRRYGFHGLSYEYIVSVLPAIAPESVRRRAVVAHLGNGAGMCAIQHGRSIATTTGFTALDGLPMGTRCGALDPGVVLYVLQHEGMDARALEHLLYEQSGCSRRIRRLERHANASCQRFAGGAGGDRPVRLSHRQGAGFACRRPRDEGDV